MDDCSTIETLERPFVAAPDPDRYFPATVIEESRRRLTRCIERGEGPALLVGGTGTGKTLLLEVLARQFRSKMTTVLLAGAQLCTRRALQQSILFQLGLPYRQLEEGDTVARRASSID
jgi:type II secretory pathway predicted ATPase ExeA